jgi:glycosyltransferase involved in cell wall biosynthesis
MKVTFVIPFHNEEKNSRPMIERVVKFGINQKFQFEVIPVDDRSTDKTAGILREEAKKYKQVHPIFRKPDSDEKGNTMGKALVSGTKVAKGDIIIWTMGDMADDTQTYLKIIRKLENGADMVFGSRYMPGGSRGNLDRIKALLSSWGTILAKLLFGVPVHDITNAFRGFKNKVSERILLESPGFSISPEFAIKAHLAGFKLAEVPTVYTNRIEGVSNFKLLRMTRSYLQLYIQLFYKYRLLNTSYDFVLQ